MKINHALVKERGGVDDGDGDREDVRVCEAEVEFQREDILHSRSSESIGEDSKGHRSIAIDNDGARIPEEVALCHEVRSFEERPFFISVEPRSEAQESQKETKEASRAIETGKSREAKANDPRV